MFLSGPVLLEIRSSYSLGKQFFYFVIFSGLFCSSTVVFILVDFTVIEMGLLYTKLYVDFEPNEWKQISTSPITFETIQDNVSLEIMATSQISYRLEFKKGGKLNLFRVVGKFRLTWDDEDIVS